MTDMHTNLWKKTAALGLTAALLLSGCGGGKEKEPEPTPPPPPPPPAGGRGPRARGPK